MTHSISVWGLVQTVLDVFAWMDSSAAMELDLDKNRLPLFSLVAFFRLR